MGLWSEIEQPRGTDSGLFPSAKAWPLTRPSGTLSRGERVGIGGRPRVSAVRPMGPQGDKGPGHVVGEGGVQVELLARHGVDEAEFVRV